MKVVKYKEAMNLIFQKVSIRTLHNKSKKKKKNNMIFDVEDIRRLSYFYE